ncbi:MAG: SDR family NAD(P)-dependent oxidoreductase [Acidobacteriota bacterium]
MKKLEGKIALVTGASQGIGLGIAQGLAAEGASLVLTARNAERLNQNAETLVQAGTIVLIIPADVADESQARIDSVQRGSYDSLIVIYQKPAKAGKDCFAFVLREGQRVPLVFDKQDKQGRALKSGDKLLRIGLKHEEGKSPLLRLIASTVGKEKGQHSVMRIFSSTARHLRWSASQ